LLQVLPILLAGPKVEVACPFENGAVFGREPHERQSAASCFDRMSPLATLFHVHPTRK
jgi:hypothetical protein